MKKFYIALIDRDNCEVSSIETETVDLPSAIAY